MPKQSTNAKKRIDKWYERAKIEGFRSRASFKLEQIDQKHRIFGSKAKCILDLCAAPGSWMQMCKKLAPASCYILGVDLDRINTIADCDSLVGDIHKQSTLDAIKSKLKGYKADVVLHDGAPNMMGNTVQDSYEQNFLSLRACEIATHFLKPGGTFVTKVFKSRTADMLRYVLTQIFKVVEQDKPIASRMQSMEIYFVCKGLKDASFEKAMFDPEHVFKEIEPVTSTKINLQKPEKVARKAEGYEDGLEVVYNTFTAAEFIDSENHEAILEVANEITLKEEDRFRHHPLTTPEILACFKDLKVLNRKDFRQLITWRRKLKKELDEEKAIAKARGEEKVEEIVPELTEEDKEIKELEEIEKEIETLNAEAEKSDKKRLKKIRKQKRELQLKMRKMKLMHTAIEENGDFFDIKQMEKVHDDPELINRIANEIEPEVKDRRVQKERYHKDDFVLSDDGMTYKPAGEDSSSDSEVSDSEDIFKKGVLNRPSKDGFEIVAQSQKKTVHFGADDSESSDEEDQQKKSSPAELDAEEIDSGLEDSDDEVVNPLTTDLLGDDKEQRKKRMAENWLNAEDVESDADSDAHMELDGAVATYLQHGGSVEGEEPIEGEENSESEVPSAVMCLDDDQDEELQEPPPKKAKMIPTKTQHVPETPKTWERKLTLDDLKDKQKFLQLVLKKASKSQPPTIEGALSHKAALPPISCINTLDVSGWGPPSSLPRKKFPPLSPFGLALAAQVVKSAKSRREHYDQGWNRYMRAEEESEHNLPEYFTTYESKHQMAHIEVDEKQEKFYEIRNRNVNVRTIKKVMEAKARKKRRLKKTMQKIIKKAEALQGSSSMSEREKTEEINKMYKKAESDNAPKKKNLVVMTKGKGGKAPKGQKGPYKMVDPRMKSDVRTKMKQMKKAKTFGRRKRR